MKYLLLTILFFRLLVAQVSIPTEQGDNTRVGANIENTITPTNVSNLKNLGSYTVDAGIFTQVLFVPSVTISSVVYNIILATTLNNTVYCFNADKPGSSPLWSTNFGSTWATPFTNYYGANIGIVGTPVVDTATGYIFFVTVNSTPTYTLRKVSIFTGTQAASVAVSGQYPGTGASGDNVSGGNVLFTAAWQIQRTGLTLANGNVYFTFGSGNEAAVWHGWIFSYDEATLTQQAVLCTTCNGNGGGIWGPGGGVTVDGSGNLYFLTGNGIGSGDYNGTTNFAMSVIKVNSSLVIQDWFTPSNWQSLSGLITDADLASGKLMFIPGTKYLTFASKDGRAWVIDSTNMGHLQGSGAAPQVFTVFSLSANFHSGTYSGGFFNSTGYFPINGQATYAFSFSGSTYNTTALCSTPSTYSQVMLTGTNNFLGSNKILWALTIGASAYSSAVPVTLRAWNPTTCAEYWNSGTIGGVSKFNSPTIVNGRVYVPTYDSGIQVYGLLPGSSNTGHTILSGKSGN